jgi:ParB-like chromosome segregation protein Spo0J
MPMRDVKIPIDEVYVPTKRRLTLDAEKVEALALDILENGQQTPIWVRRDEARFVLVEGLHRLEACRTLGDTTITALLVQARRY